MGPFFSKPLSFPRETCFQRVTPRTRLAAVPNIAHSLSAGSSLDSWFILVHYLKLICPLVQGTSETIRKLWVFQGKPICDTQPLRFSRSFKIWSYYCLLHQLTSLPQVPFYRGGCTGVRNPDISGPRSGPKLLLSLKEADCAYWGREHWPRSQRLGTRPKLPCLVGCELILITSPQMRLTKPSSFQRP